MVTPLKADVSYAVLDSKAAVTIAKDAALTADTGNISLNADNTVSADVGTTLKTFSVISPGTTYIPAAAMLRQNGPGRT